MADKTLKSWKKVKLDLATKTVTQVVKMGGYWYIDNKFPFIHSREEEIYAFTADGLYKLVVTNERQT